MEIQGIKDDDRIYPLWKAAEVLGISRAALWGKVRRGLIPHVRQGTPNQPRYYLTGRMIYAEIRRGIVPANNRKRKQRKKND